MSFVDTCEFVFDAVQQLFLCPLHQVPLTLQLL